MRVAERCLPSAPGWYLVSLDVRSSWPASWGWISFPCPTAGPACDLLLVDSAFWCKEVRPTKRSVSCQEEEEDKGRHQFVLCLLWKAETPRVKTWKQFGGSGVLGSK